MSSCIPKRVVRISDKDGHTVKLNKVSDDYYLPVSVTKEKMEGLSTLEVFPDDVWICTYVKSGSHWLWEMVVMLLEGTTDKHTRHWALLEAVGKDFIDTVQRPRAIVTHLRPSMLPKQVWEQNAKVIHFVRNPKDVVSSLFHHVRAIPTYEYKGKFAGYVDLFLKGSVDFGSWFDYTVEWWKKTTDNPNILLLTYENTIKDHIVTIRTVATFLGVLENQERFRQIAEATTFENQKERHFSRRSAGYDDDNNLFRKGKVGDWKNHFDEELTKLFDETYEQKLKFYSELKRMIRFDFFDE